MFIPLFVKTRQNSITTLAEHRRRLLLNHDIDMVLLLLICLRSFFTTDTLLITHNHAFG